MIPHLTQSVYEEFHWTPCFTLLEEEKTALPCLLLHIYTGTSVHALRKIDVYKYGIYIQDSTQFAVFVCTNGDLLPLQPIKSGINHDRSRKLPATQHDIQTSNNNKM